MIKFDARLTKNLMKRSGKKYKRETVFEITFAVRTPTDYFDPAEDTVLLLELLNTIETACEFHDMPSYQLGQVIVNRETVLG